MTEKEYGWAATFFLQVWDDKKRSSKKTKKNNKRVLIFEKEYARKELLGDFLIIPEGVSGNLIIINNC